MGNNASNSHGRVVVALERSQYFAGELARGYVEVRVDSEMSCSELHIRFFGEANVVVHYTTSSGKGTVTHTAKETDVLVEERRLVACFPAGRVSPGLYQFPFLFALNPCLVSSCCAGSHDHASIVYGVEVQLERPGFKRNLLHKALFDLVAHVPHPIVPEITLDTKNVKTCCLFGQGRVTIGAALERNAFRANEAVLVRVEIDNQSSVSVQQVVVQLRECITFRARGHKTSVRSILAKETLGPVHPGEGYGRIKKTQPLIVTLCLPRAFLHCTVATKVLQVHHFVEIRAETGLFNSTPTVTLPVTLHRSGVFTPSAPLLLDDDGVGVAPLGDYLPNPAALGSPVPVDSAAAPSAVAQQAFQLSQRCVSDAATL